MTAPYTLRCLGRPALIGPDGRPVRFRTRKHLAILVYLAVESRAAHRRDRLVDLLWPNASHGEGRHSLSTALSVLRAKLGRPAIKSSRDHVQLVMADLELDLHRLTDGQLLETDLMPALEVAGFSRTSTFRAPRHSPTGGTSNGQPGCHTSKPRSGS